MEGQVLSYRSRPPALRYQWTSSPEASAYLLEAADNPLLQNPALSLRVRSGTGDQLSVVSSALEQGVWYWRVTPVYSRDILGSPSEGGQQASLVQSFVIERGAPLVAPVLTAPAENALLNIEAGRRDILFSWRRENEAASYTFRVSANSNMSSPVIEQTLAETFYRYGSSQTALTPGTWYWTVHQTGPGGENSPASQPRVFSALRGEAIQRQIFPPDHYMVADNLLPDMRFTWKTNLPDTRIQISQNEGFNPLVIDEPVSSEVYTARTLRSGVYFWRITGGTGTQQRESPARRLAVAGSLPAPELRRPESGYAVSQTGSIIFSERLPAVNFSWDPAPGAGYYSFKLYRGSDTSQAPVLEATVNNTAFSVNMNGYDDGSYTWTVQSHARESTVSSRRTGFSAAQPMNIRQLRPVIIEHPRNGWTYDGIAASRSPDTARWSSHDVPYNVVFILARDALMRNIVHRQSETDLQIVLPPRLGAGDYFWTIQAVDAEGYDISSYAPAHFRVLPVPPLPPPRGRLPASEHTITPEHVRAERSVAFSWNEVEGANSYMLTVLRDDAARSPVIQTPLLTENGYTVEDVRLLGRGEFLWQVEALYVMDDGFIVQRGELAGNKLIIDIPFPQQIRTMDSGILYGR